MSAVAQAEPVVAEDHVDFAVPDPERDLRRIALLHELRRPRSIAFVRRRAVWRLRLPRPPVDRLEYVLEREHSDGTVELGPDEANPLRARGVFGDKSVVEFPEYEQPAWVADESVRTGDVRALQVDSRRLRGRAGGLLWSAADSDPAAPLPLLVVHDGPEYAEYSRLTRLLDHLVDFGEVPPFRAALLAPPGDRNEAYSASARYANALAADVLPAVKQQAPTGHDPVLIGASLGALAALHVHWLHPGLLGGLFLQSGSFFRRRFDSHESRFGRFGRITRFVGRVHGGRGIVARIPARLTCGTGEENLDNNRALTGILRRRDWDAALVEHPDAHNWTSWRDSLHPQLAELMLRVWT